MPCPMLTFSQSDYMICFVKPTIHLNIALRGITRLPQKKQEPELLYRHLEVPSTGCSGFRTTSTHNSFTFCGFRRKHAYQLREFFDDFVAVCGVFRWFHPLADYYFHSFYLFLLSFCFILFSFFCVSSCV